MGITRGCREAQTPRPGPWGHLSTPAPRSSHSDAPGSPGHPQANALLGALQTPLPGAPHRLNQDGRWGPRTSASCKDPQM